MNIEEKFINYISAHYDELKNRFQSFCYNKHYQWDEDIFSDTYLKCYETIKKKGTMNDSSPKGIEDYFFRSFKQNTQREKQYSRVTKKDSNITDIAGIYESYYNNNNTTALKKVQKDLYNDFSILYLARQLEQNVDSQAFYLWRLKSFIPNMTYRKLSEITGVKSCRTKVVYCKNWLREHVSQKDIQKAFDTEYGNSLKDE